MDTAVEAGLLCIDTQRRIQYSPEEIKTVLEAAPSEFTLGEGDEVATFKYRKVEDPTLPVWISPLSIAMTEDLFIPVVEGIVSVPEVDVLEGLRSRRCGAAPSARVHPTSCWWASGRPRPTMRPYAARAVKAWACLRQALLPRSMASWAVMAYRAGSSPNGTSSSFFHPSR